MDWHRVREATSPDGTRWMCIETSGDLFRFTEAILSYDVHAGEYWEPSYGSGYYASADEAEVAACWELPWMRGMERH